MKWMGRPPGTRCHCCSSISRTWTWSGPNSSSKRSKAQGTRTEGQGLQGGPTLLSPSQRFSQEALHSEVLRGSRRYSLHSQFPLPSARSLVRGLRGSCFTRKRSEVQNLPRPPPEVPGHLRAKRSRRTTEVVGAPCLPPSDSSLVNDPTI